MDFKVARVAEGQGLMQSLVLQTASRLCSMRGVAVKKRAGRRSRQVRT